MEFSKVLHTLRTKRGLSQKELAQSLEVAQASINYWEKGQRTPSIEAAQKIADYFGVTLNYLMTGNEADKITLKRNGQIETFDMSKIVEAINEHTQKDIKDFVKTFYGNDEKRKELIIEILKTHNYKVEEKDIHHFIITDHQGFSFLVNRDDFADMAERCDKDIRYNVEKLLSDSRELKK
ncbi:helix-turn-helix transcriptional regulator [Clostridium sp. FS41]|jgi:transcriptional regulator with XRE-family HTH domain|uniref:helix-turn-helix domain-containing protein n=1 Tax=Clostridium sp. FS41 TaxID=1609975 RepID=UPI00061FDA85|nr:helix-turn-helix transcriptional regulator [Clostridium sp. FS41]KJJ71699.1 HTH-type transcriptional regulator Xre [Clostridium sp. FS41]